MDEKVIDNLLKISDQSVQIILVTGMLRHYEITLPEAIKEIEESLTSLQISLEKLKQF
jgi:3-dehydroquinate dehydratase